MNASQGPVAAIDIGTNSVRLLITDASGQELLREMFITRLGQGVDRTGGLAPEAVERTLEVLRRYGACLREHAITDALRITATSAARDANNRDVFFQAVQQAVGKTPELLSGEDEAKLSFAGATAGMPTADAPFLIFDIGGGSTEFAKGTERPESFISIDMGGVRMTERFLSSDPPHPDELQRCREFVHQQLQRVEDAVPPAGVKTWVGLAGTVTSCAAFSLGLTEYDPTKTHGYALSRAEAANFLQAMAEATVAQRRELLLEKKRADVIVGGALVLDVIYEHFALASVRVSEKDILDGLAASLR